MSAVSMAERAFARRNDHNLPAPTRKPGSTNGAAADPAAPSDALSSAVAAIVTYFPTEVNILYTAIVAAIVTTDATTTSHAGQWVAFYFVLVLAPIISWLLYAARVKKQTGKLPLRPTSWPFLEMLFSTIAFAVWAAALPASPLRDLKHFNSGLASAAVLVVSMLLGLLAPVLGKTIDVKKPRRAARKPARPAAEKVATGSEPPPT